jgi:hypothetical protein
MANPRRNYVPGRVYETTTRVINEELRLRPSPVVNAIVLGVIARAMFLFPKVNVHYFVALSNHMHMLLSAGCGEQFAKFVSFVNGNIARRVGRIDGKRSRFWARRARVIPVLDAESMMVRLRYQLSHGCKEGLVAAPKFWPGASAYSAFAGNGEMSGVWHDQDGERRKARSGKPYDATQFRHAYPIKLTPIPAWADLSASERKARHRSLIDQVEQETRKTNRRMKRLPLGVAAVLAQDPTSRPANPKRSPAPLCHAATERARDEYRATYEEFINQYVRAADAVRRGEADVDFPPGSFPRAGQWVPFPPAS